jgi:hypothetical protein
VSGSTEIPRSWAASSRKRSRSSDSASGGCAAISMISGRIVALGGSRTGVLGLFRRNLMPRASVAATRRLARFLTATPPAEAGRGNADRSRAAWAEPVRGVNYSPWGPDKIAYWCWNENSHKYRYF